jgi:pyruvate kinase
MKPLELIVTLWPTQKHFERFAADERIGAIRMNSAFAYGEGEKVLAEAQRKAHGTTLYLDLKGRQMRVREAIPNNKYCELRISHPISVDKLPAVALFKGGNDAALLTKIIDGDHLVFARGPKYRVEPGESLHIRDPSLKVHGTILPLEQRLIKAARDSGYDHYVLSYVEGAADFEEFRTYVGPDAEVIGKIESQKGVQYVKQEYEKLPHTGIMAARGDLFVEVGKPHDIVAATRAIAKADPDAVAASRILLSVTNEAVPSCADFSDLAFLLGCGYRRLMICDGVALKEDSLAKTVNIIEAFTSDNGYELVKDYRAATMPLPAGSRR